ncbi:hypothetical protein IAT40_005826 [Kwoniella sp. CBS 6097]
MKPTRSPAASSSSSSSSPVAHHRIAPVSDAVTTDTRTSTSSLSFPSIAFRGSFANIFKALRGDHRRGSIDSEEDEEEDDEEEDAGSKGVEDEDGEQDADSLMWDAQTALISHQVELAVKLYTQAALPPYQSPSACLALGNLLIRGSTLAEHDEFTSPSPSTSPPTSPLSSHDVKGKSKLSELDQSRHTTASAPSFFSRLFGSPPVEEKQGSTSQPNSNSARPEPIRRGTTDLVASGWQIPREGKRAVRDAKSMGVAAAWFILGLGWLVQAQVEREEKDRADQKRKAEEQDSSRKRVNGFLNGIPDGVVHHVQSEGDEAIPEDEILSFGPKTRTKSQSRRTEFVPAGTRTSSPASRNIPDSTERLHESNSTITASASTTTLCPPESGPSSSSGRTTESPMVQTPGIGMEPFADPFMSERMREEALQQMFDLLSPLLHLYRHGHIQAQDPVSLPPISLHQLPAALRPKNETDKRRNVWHLGGVLSSRMIKLDLLAMENLGGREQESMKNVDKLKGAVNILTKYILAMTSRDHESEIYFRNVISTPPTGIAFADDLIRQAAKRLDIITSTPRDETDLQGFPFPQTAATYNATRPDSSTTASNADYYLSPPKISTKTSPSNRRGSSPTLSKGRNQTHTRQPSTASGSSTMSTAFSRILSSPVKASPSVASLSTFSTSDPTAESFTVELGGTAKDHVKGSARPSVSGENGDSAISTLRRIHARSLTDLSTALDPDGPEEYDHDQQEQEENVRYPSLEGWRMSPPADSDSRAISSSRAEFGTSHRSQRTIVPSSYSARIGSGIAVDGQSPQSQAIATAVARLSLVSSRDIQPGLSVSPADTLRPVASSPQIGSLRLSRVHASSTLLENDRDATGPFASSRSRTSPSTPRRKLPFEPTGEIAPIDPSLAAAELSSALTKHVTCGVCGGSGVNFPECRKCGLTFCSRDCRIGNDKAGNGKKHVCGAWESRRLLSVPTSRAPVALSKSGIPQSHFEVDRASSPVKATTVF